LDIIGYLDPENIGFVVRILYLSHLGTVIGAGANQPLSTKNVEMTSPEVDGGDSEISE